MGSLPETLGLTGDGVVSLVGAGGKTSLMFRLANEFATVGEPVLTTTTTKIMMPTTNQASQVVLANTSKSLLAQARVLLANHRHITAASSRLSDAPGKIRGFSPGDIDKIWASGPFRWIIVEADGAAKKPLKAPADHEPVIPSSSNYVIGVIGLKALGNPVGDKWIFRHDRYSRITGCLPGKPITTASVVAAVLHQKGLFKNASPRTRKILFLNAFDSPRGVKAAKAIAHALCTGIRGRFIERIVVGEPLEKQSVIACFEGRSCGVNKKNGNP